MTQASASPDSIFPARHVLPRSGSACSSRFHVTVDTLWGIVDARQTHSSRSDLAVEPAYKEVHHFMSIETAEAILRNGAKELACRCSTLLSEAKPPLRHHCPDDDGGLDAFDPRN